MFKQYVRFLHRRPVDNLIVLDTAMVVYKNFLEMKNTDEETKVHILRNMGFNVVRIVQPRENIIGVNFKRESTK